MDLSSLKRAILLEAGFRAFWNNDSITDGAIADLYRSAFVTNAAVNRARNELTALAFEEAK